MKDDFGRKIIQKCIGLRPKTYSYLRDDGSEHKKSKSYKKVCHKNITINDDKRMQSIYLIEAYAYETSNDLVSKKKRFNVMI